MPYVQGCSAEEQRSLTYFQRVSVFNIFLGGSVQLPYSFAILCTSGDRKTFVTFIDMFMSY